jgi:hypothetical protein
MMNIGLDMNIRVVGVNKDASTALPVPETKSCPWFLPNHMAKSSEYKLLNAGATSSNDGNGALGSKKRELFMLLAIK